MKKNNLKGRLDLDIIYVYINNPPLPKEEPLFTFQILFKELDYKRLKAMATNFYSI